MIHVVTAENRRLYAGALAEMHRLRRTCCDDERGPADLVIRDGGEYDAFDDRRAIYLMSLGPEGRVGCAMRLRPTVSGSLLTGCFPRLLAPDEAGIDAPDTWEISRYFAAPHCLGPSGVAIRAEIRLAALETVHARGGRRLAGVVELAVLPRLISATGWRIRTLGLPAPTTRGVVQAIEIEVTEAAIEDLAETFGLDRCVGLELGPEEAGGAPPHEVEALVRLARGDTDRSRILGALIRRILEIQDGMEEERLIGMVSYVEALLRESSGRLH